MAKGFDSFKAWELPLAADFALMGVRAISGTREDEGGKQWEGNYKSFFFTLFSHDCLFGVRRSMGRARERLLKIQVLEQTRKGIWDGMGWDGWGCAGMWMFGMR